MNRAGGSPFIASTRGAEIVVGSSSRRGYSKQAARARMRGCAAWSGGAHGGRGTANGVLVWSATCGVQRRGGGDSGGCGVLSGRRLCLGACWCGGERRGASGGRGVVWIDGVVPASRASARHGSSAMGAGVATSPRRLLGLGLLWQVQVSEGRQWDMVVQAGDQRGQG